MEILGKLFGRSEGQYPREADTSDSQWRGGVRDLFSRIETLTDEERDGLVKQFELFDVGGKSIWVENFADTGFGKRAAEKMAEAVGGVAYNKSAFFETLDGGELSADITARGWSVWDKNPLEV